MIYNPSTLQYCNSAPSSVTDGESTPSRPFTLPPLQWAPHVSERQDLPRSNSGTLLPKPAREEKLYRRLSHSAIEKRRRERMNDKIDQLKHLIPTCSPSTTTTLPPASMHQPLHKLSVLQAAIEYIHHLHTELLQHSSLVSQQQDTSLANIIAHAHRLQQDSNH